MESLGNVLKRASMARSDMPLPYQEQDTCPICHGAGYLRHDVPVEDPRFGQIVPCECTRRDMERRRIERLVERSKLGELRMKTFESFTRKIVSQNPPARSAERAFKVARQYAENPRGWLVLFGDIGTGKTHLGAAVANFRLSLGEPAVFIVVPDLLDHLRSTFSPSSDVTYDELFETVRDTPMLVLDDLGAQATTPWAEEKLYQILNHRYNKQLPTVITTNRSMDDMDPRLRSRVNDFEISQRCEVRGPDFRQGATISTQRPVEKRPQSQRGGSIREVTH
ncbi:MAG TPA: ATP-binding protein [Chloroflexota bacterium]